MHLNLRSPKFDQNKKGGQIFLSISFETFSKQKKNATKTNSEKARIVVHKQSEKLLDLQKNTLKIYSVAKKADRDRQITASITHDLTMLNAR